MPVIPWEALPPASHRHRPPPPSALIVRRASSSLPRYSFDSPTALRPSAPRFAAQASLAPAFQALVTAMVTVMVTVPARAVTVAGPKKSRDDWTMGENGVHGGPWVGGGCGGRGPHARVHATASSVVARLAVGCVRV